MIKKVKLLIFLLFLLLINTPSIVQASEVTLTEDSPNQGCAVIDDNGRAISIPSFERKLKVSIDRGNGSWVYNTRYGWNKKYGDTSVFHYTKRHQAISIVGGSRRTKNAAPYQWTDV